MKSILIIGKNSYIGKSFADYLRDKSIYNVDEISVRNDKWKEESWEKYDVVINFTGIAHKSGNSVRKEDYYRINRDLAIKLAFKAKNDKVKHFIQISTMSVFGPVNKIITKSSKENPLSDYGKSKLEADKSINKLADGKFFITIVRPPMVYGPDSPGNYQRLSKLAKILFIFPNYKNKRSMIFIDNLCEFILICINKNLEGIFCPQNIDYVGTSKLVKQIRKVNGKKTTLINVEPLILFLIKYFSVFNKIFGDLVYTQEISSFELNYNLVDFKTSIKESEKRGVK